MVNHDFYMSTYGGSSIALTEWDFFEKQARAQLDRYRRIYTITVPEGSSDAEHLAICAMADVLAYFVAAQNGAGGMVAATSIGSVSTSYAGVSGGAVDLSAKGQAEELYRCASLYLDIYRGVG